MEVACSEPPPGDTNLGFCFFLLWCLSAISIFLQEAQLTLVGSVSTSYLVCFSDNLWYRLDKNSLLSEVWVEDYSKDDSNLKSFNCKSSSSRKMNLWCFKVFQALRGGRRALCEAIPQTAQGCSRESLGSTIALQQAVKLKGCDRCEFFACNYAQRLKDENAQCEELLSFL